MEAGGRTIRDSDLLPTIFCFAFFVSVALLGSGDTPLLSDNQHYFFIAERAAAGVPPHISQFDPKNALGMLLTAAAIVTGRVIGIDDIAASRIVSIGAGALAVALVWPLARRMTGSRTAAWIAFVGMMSLERFMIMSVMGSQPKIFLVAFLEASMLALGAGRVLASGAMAAAAFLCWQPAGALLVTGPLALILAREGVRKVVAFALAAALPIVAYEAYFLYHGALAEQIEQAFIFPSNYMESFPATLHPVLRRARWTFAVSQGVDAKSIVPLVSLVGLGLFWLGMIRPRSRTAAAFRGRADRIYLVATAHVALLSCLVSFQGFPDRFWLDPLMAIAAGWVFSVMADRLSALIPAVSWHSFARATCAASLLWMALAGRWDFSRLDGLDAQRRAADALGDLLDLGYSVYSVGCTHLLAMNHVGNFSPYGFFFRGVEEYLEVKTDGRGYVPLREGAPPDIILLSRGKYLQKQPWFERDYVRVKRDEFSGQMIQVWLRADVLSGRVNRGSPAREAASP
jgi:hypothetical protein